MKLPVHSASLLALLACTIQAQENSPSWRTESDMPTRLEAPEVTKAPEIEFKVDRSALMGGFDSGFGSDDSNVEETSDAEAESSTVTEQVAEIEGTPVVPQLALSEEPVVDVQAASELPSEVSPEIAPEAAFGDQPAQSSALVSSELIIEQLPAESDQQAVEESAVLAYLEPTVSTLEEITVDPVAINEPPTRTTGFQLIAVDAVDPEYPRDAWLEKTEGWVDVHLTIDAGGNVADATVVSAEPRRVFDRSALRALRKSTFRPPSEFGLSGPQTARLRIEFDLGS